MGSLSNMDMQTPCQVKVTPHKSEGIEPFSMVNSLPCQVKAMSLDLTNTTSGQVRVTPCKSEGIEPFTTVNSLLCQVWVTPHQLECIKPFNMVNPLPCQVKSMSSHPINTPSGQFRVTPCKSEGIKPFTMVNSLPCQVRVTPCQLEGIEPFSRSTLHHVKSGHVLTPNQHSIGSPCGCILNRLWVTPVTSLCVPYLLMLFLPH